MPNLITPITPTHEDSDYTTRFLTAQATFAKAMFELLEAWNAIDDNCPDLAGTFGVTGYPFAESFDEMLLKVIDWQEATRRARLPKGLI